MLGCTAHASLPAIESAVSGFTGGAPEETTSGPPPAEGAGAAAAAAADAAVTAAEAAGGEGAADCMGPSGDGPIPCPWGMYTGTAMKIGWPWPVIPWPVIPCAMPACMPAGKPGNPAGTDTGACPCPGKAM